MDKSDLENRLINFAVLIIDIAAGNKRNYAGDYLGDKIIKSATAISITYNESQSVKSNKEVRLKMQLILKELREILVNLKIITAAKLNAKTRRLFFLLDENIQLITVVEKCTLADKKIKKIKHLVS